MATNRWIANAIALAQLQTFTVGGTPATNQTYSVTFNGKSVTYTALVSDTNTTIATALYTLLSASSVPPEFQEETWANPSAGVITATAKVAGRPFTCTSSASGTGTLTNVVTTASSGPSDVSLVANYSLGYMPQSALSAPVQANATATAGGTLADSTTYYWTVTALNQNGETVASNEKSLAISGSNQTGVISWAAVTGAVSYNVYRGTSPGGENHLITNTTSLTFNDTGATGSVQSPPGVSTAVGDDFYVDLASTPMLYNLNAMQGYVLNSLNVLQQFSGQGTIGLPAVNSTNASPGNSYFEYRPKYLAVSATTINIGKGTGGGSGRIKIDAGSNAFTCNVYNTGNALDGPAMGALQIKGTNAANVLNITKGTVSVAPVPGDSATLATLTIGYVSNVNSDSTVTCFNGVTLTTVKQTGGVFVYDSNVTTFTQTGGTATQISGNLTTLVGEGGTLYYQGNGTITTWTLAAGQTLDFSQNNQSRTLTNKGTLYKGAVFNDPLGTATLSAGWETYGCSLSDVKVNCGPSRSYTVA